MIGLQSAFSAQPNGGTALIGTLRQIYNDKINCASKDRKLLIIVVTDGEPTDGTRTDLYNTLVEITRYGNVHVSFAECTDNAEDMEYLDAWDGCIKNFDNTDDYREELQRVKMVQGMQFKFDYNDYVIKILLATFVRWYFNIDQVKVFDPRNTSVSGNPAAYGSNYQMQYGNQVQAYPSVQKLYSPPVQPYNVTSTVPSVQPYNASPVQQQYNMVQQYNVPSTVQPVQQYNVTSTVQPTQPYSVVQQQTYYTTTTTTTPPRSTSLSSLQTQPSPSPSPTPPRSTTSPSFPTQEKKSSCQIL